MSGDCGEGNESSKSMRVEQHLSLEDKNIWIWSWYLTKEHEEGQKQTGTSDMLGHLYSRYYRFGKQ